MTHATNTAVPSMHGTKHARTYRVFHPRCPEEERDPGAGLAVSHLAPEAVLASRPAVIAGERHHGVVGKAEPVQQVERLPDQVLASTKKG